MYPLGIWFRAPVTILKWSGRILWKMPPGMFFAGSNRLSTKENGSLKAYVTLFYHTRNPHVLSGLVFYLLYLFFNRCIVPLPCRPTSRRNKRVCSAFIFCRVESWRSGDYALFPAPPHQTVHSICPNTAFRLSSSRSIRRVRPWSLGRYFIYA